MGEPTREAGEVELQLDKRRGGEETGPPDKAQGTGRSGKGAERGKGREGTEADAGEPRGGGAAIEEAKACEAGEATTEVGDKALEAEGST